MMKKYWRSQAADSTSVADLPGNMFEMNNAGQACWSVRTLPELTFNSADLRIQGRLSKIRLTDSSGSCHEYQAKLGDVFVQEPALTMSAVIDSDIGLSLVFRFLPFEKVGILSEFRMQTVSDVANINLTLDVAISADTDLVSSSGREPIPLGQTYEAVAGAIFLCRSQRNDTVLLADLGEKGTCTRVEEANSGPCLRYEFFKQSLEKGVIFVGQLGVVPFDRLAQDEELSRLLGHWESSKTYL